MGVYMSARAELVDSEVRRRCTDTAWRPSKLLAPQSGHPLSWERDFNNPCPTLFFLYFIIIFFKNESF